MKIFISTVLLLFAVSAIFAQTRAEVITTTTYLFETADANSKKLKTVAKGDKITIENSEEKNGWIFASVSNGKIKGWIKKGFVRLTETPKQSNQTQQQSALPQKTNQPAVTETPKVTASAAETPKQLENAETAPIEDDEVLKVETVEVNLNVRVVDENNRAVVNLNQDSFKVYEDGVLQPITSFTTSEVPIIDALVIDNSRSLRSQLGKVIDAGKIIIGTNRPKDESTIVRFVSRDKIEILQDFTQNKNSLENALDNLFVEGGQTALIDAVYKTAKKVDQHQKSPKNDDPRLRAVIVVSDGDDRGSTVTERQLFELLRNSNVQVYAIGFTENLNNQIDENGANRREKAEALLKRLANETGGKVYFPTSLEELPQIAKEISSELRTQYFVSYSPTNENRDGSFRKIKVEISDGTNKEKRSAITRNGRNALVQ